MKQYCKWIAAVFTAASTTAAFAWTGSCSYGPFGASSCGYSSCRLAPVGERVIYTQSCPSRAYYYSEPTPGQFLGNVISAPFRLVGGALSWTGQTLSGQPAVVASSDLAPVGERFTTVRVIRHRTILQPVGERFTTVRVIRHRTILQPVGERFTTVKVIRYGKMLKPVGERCTKITTTKLVKHHGKKVALRKTSYRCGMLKPVGERTIIRTQKVLLPVGQRVWTYSTPSCGCM